MRAFPRSVLTSIFTTSLDFALALHTSGVWLLTDLGGVRYVVSKVVIAVAAYLVWNYPMNRHFVFPARPVDTKKVA